MTQDKKHPGHSDGRHVFDQMGLCYGEGCGVMEHSRTQVQVSDEPVVRIYSNGWVVTSKTLPSECAAPLAGVAAAILALRPAPKCQTCNGHGLVGGHMQDGSGYGEGCHDCNPEPQALAIAKDDAELRDTLLEHLDNILDAKALMLAAGVPQADFPSMFREFAARATAAQGEVVAWVYCDDIFWHNAPDLSDHIRQTGRPLVYGTPQPTQAAQGEPSKPLFDRDALHREMRELGYTTNGQTSDLIDLFERHHLAAQPAPVVADEPSGREVLKQVFALCEDTEAQEHIPPRLGEALAFERGRKTEAKGIRNAIGTWFQDAMAAAQKGGE